jgi:hypothetical protein
VIVRYELDNGAETYATVPARIADQIGSLNEFAQGLLSVVPRAACIQVWADGRSFTARPDVEARPPKTAVVPRPSDLVVDVATAFMLTAAGQTAPRVRRPPTGTATRGRAGGSVNARDYGRHARNGTAVER